MFIAVDCSPEEFPYVGRKGRNWVYVTKKSEATRFASREEARKAIPARFSWLLRPEEEVTGGCAEW